MSNKFDQWIETAVESNGNKGRLDLFRTMLLSNGDSPRLDIISDDQSDAVQVGFWFGSTDAEERIPGFIKFNTEEVQRFIAVETKLHQTHAVAAVKAASGSPKATCNIPRKAWMDFSEDNGGSLSLAELIDLHPELGGVHVEIREGKPDKTTGKQSFGFYMERWHTSRAPQIEFTYADEAGDKHTVKQGMWNHGGALFTVLKSKDAESYEVLDKAIKDEPAVLENV